MPADKLSILLQRGATLEPAITTAVEALELANREGARYLGIDAGVLELGRLADIAVVDLTAPHQTPVHRAVATLAYATTGRGVTMTIVGGEIVYDQAAVRRWTKPPS